jgi:hypothetical protein
MQGTDWLHLTGGTVLLMIQNAKHDAGLTMMHSGTTMTTESQLIHGRHTLHIQGQ